MNAILKPLDIPPVWLLVMLGLTYGIKVIAPQMAFYLPGQGLVGGGLIVLGVGAMCAAVAEFVRHRTTVVPRGVPTAFLHRGIYRLSRNPIYLGDALILSGAILWWGGWLALPLVPLFIVLITRRFILGEEHGLRQIFGAAFEDWAQRTRRWI